MLFRAPLLRLLFGTIEDSVMDSALTYLTVSVFSYLFWRSTTQARRCSAHRATRVSPC